MALKITFEERPTIPQFVAKRGSTCRNNCKQETIGRLSLLRDKYQSSLPIKQRTINDGVLQLSIS